MSKEELEQYCEDVANDLIDYIKGNTVYSEDEGDFVENTEDVEDDGLGGYISDCLDITVYACLKDGTYEGCRIAVAVGGPNVYIDTFRRCVEGFWGAEHVVVNLPTEVTDEIDEIVEEYWETE